MSWVQKRAQADGSMRFTATYRDPSGAGKSAGTFMTRREAERAGRRAEQKVESGTWLDPSAGRITFRDYVENVWWPSRHLEVSTKAGYRANLDKHFLPYFGDMPMAAILPSAVQAWVTQAAATELSPRSIVKYHVMLHGIFKRAVRDRVIAHNPSAETELPKVILRQRRIVTPEEFELLIREIPKQHAALILTSIETGLRWGELIALRPRHVNFLHRVITVEETVVEVSKKVSPTGERMIIKPYPKNNKPRAIGVSRGLLDLLAERIRDLGLNPDELIFPSNGRAGGNPMSRNTFRTRVWLPALEAAEIGFHVRMHDLRHAHASWLLAGGADLMTVMTRMGHSQIQTTQKYLHALPDADERALSAFERVRLRSHA